MRTPEQPARRPEGIEARSPHRELNADALIGAQPDTSDNQILSDLATRLVQEPQPQPTWELIDTAPKDGRDVIVRWGDDDEEGRVVRWHPGRWFNNRRWVAGGRWSPSDGMQPLVSDPPTHWLKPPASEDDEEAVETEDESAAA